MEMSGIGSPQCDAVNKVSILPPVTQILRGWRFLAL